jgi:hypothetical protein
MGFWKPSSSLLGRFCGNWHFWAWGVCSLVGSSVNSQLDEEGRYLSCEKKNDVGLD